MEKTYLQPKTVPFPVFGPGFGEIRKWSNKMCLDQVNMSP